MNYQWVYAAVSPAGLAQIIGSHWRCLGRDFPGQTHIYLKQARDYAAQIARSWHAPQYAAGYVVQLRVREGFLARYPLQTIAYQAHLEYRLPCADLEQLSRHSVGRIRVVGAYQSERRALSLQRQLEWSQAL